MLDISWILSYTTFFVVPIVIVVSNRCGDVGDDWFVGIDGRAGYVVVAKQIVDSTAIDAWWPKDNAAATQ